MPPFSPQTLARLAREVAMNIRPFDDILADYGLTTEMYEDLKERNPFKNILLNYIQEWNSSLSTPERIRIEAAAALEEHLPALANRMGDPKEPLSGAVETGKLLAKLAEIGEQKSAGSHERFSITISLGAEKAVTIENVAQSIKEIPPNPEGESEPVALQSLPERESPEPEGPTESDRESAYETLQHLSQRLSRLSDV